jgi:hypothetical protein
MVVAITWIIRLLKLKVRPCETTDGLCASEGWACSRQERAAALALPIIKTSKSDS